MLVFFAYFRVSQKKNIKQSPNGMKPFGAIFLNKRDPEDLEWKSRNKGGGHEGARRAPYRWARPPTIMGPSSVHRPTSSSYVYPCTPKISEATTKNYLHRRNLLYPLDPILEPSSALRRRGNRPWRASTSTREPLR